MASNSLCKYRLYNFFFPKKCNPEQVVIPEKVVVPQPSNLQPANITLQSVQEIANANTEKRKQLNNAERADDPLNNINNPKLVYFPTSNNGYKLKYDTYTDENYPNEHIAVGGKSRRKRRRKTKRKRRGRRRRTSKRKTKSQQRK